MFSSNFRDAKQPFSHRCTDTQALNFLSRSDHSVPVKTASSWRFSFPLHRSEDNGERELVLGNDVNYAQEHNYDKDSEWLLKKTPFFSSLSLHFSSNRVWRKWTMYRDSYSKQSSLIPYTYYYQSPRSIYFQFSHRVDFGHCSSSPHPLFIQIGTHTK